MSQHQLTEEELKEVQKAAGILAQSFDTLTSEQRKELISVLGMGTLDPHLVPPDWSPYANAPYYKKKYAINIKIILDKMWEESVQAEHDKMKCKDWLVEASKFRISVRSLIMRFNQAFLYLVHHMDTPDRHYKQMREEIVISKEGHSVRFRWKEKVRVSIDAVPVDDRGTMEWKQELEDFIETAKEGGCLVLKNRALDRDNLMYIQKSLVGIKGFYVLQLETNMVRILRTDVEEQEIK